ncbi:MAG: 4Fe-4S dicluster domain-containing protein [Tepidanaerobacteraceae bacterium]|nr:4Fe-4S binding protein [Thermoanaerobacterales bacterium]
MAEEIRIFINEKACKRCGLCIAFCPRNVYKSEGGKPIIVNLDACTNCKLCELRCPDYAIIVGGEENE